ncbi:MAG: ribonuclease H [Bacteroidetes bacterium CG2_30_33_31]|nr:MAG: ribonuclease H [Bacteroidetes bacterium CG2_30_33_31]
MAKTQKKYYVVWEGYKPGIYQNWADCMKQVNGFSKPVFKSFTRHDVAEKAFSEFPEKYFSENYSEPIIFADKAMDSITLAEINTKKNTETPIIKALAVDAACSGNPGVLEYQGVDVSTKEMVFHQGPFALGTVNIGEFLALVHGLAYLKKEGKSYTLYSDSITAISWVRRKAIKTNLPRNAKTEELFKLVDRAIAWLQNNEWKNPIAKWNTKEWGEIPADFGRK